MSYVGTNAMGAMSFLPLAADMGELLQHIPLHQLAADVQDVLAGEGGAFLQKLLQIGGSPQGARPQALLYRNPVNGAFSTAEAPGLEAWLIKFPGQHEHPEVCAIEEAHAQCLRACGIDTPDTAYFALPNGQTAFASRRFDRQEGMRVPMQSLAAFVGADFRVPGTLDYANFLRATQMCTNDVRQKARAFERVVFNVAFNNRDGHTKNFAHLMSPRGDWTLAPAYDVTFCEGPGGYHQMDVMGEALEIGRESMLALGTQEAELRVSAAAEIIERICNVANTFAATVRQQFPQQVTQDTLDTIERRINDNIQRLR